MLKNKSIMKINLYLIFLIGMSFVSLVGGSTNVQSPINYGSKKNQKATFPFGCSILKSHQFPQHWDMPSDDDESSQAHENVNQKALDEIDKFYGHLNKSPSIIGPLIKIENFVLIDHESQLMQYEKVFKAKFKYQLPNIGPYQTYYQYVEVPMPYYYKLENKSDGSDKLYLQYGNLVLYNPKTMSAQILNIYNTFSYKEPTGGFSRFFYIEKSGIIKIFESGEGESSSFLKMTKIITVFNNGQISISNPK